MGWQACGLTGKAYIDADLAHSESLQHIEAGDTATFRYVASDAPFREVQLRCEGKGSVNVLLNGKKVGSVEVDGSSDIYTAPIQADAGCYELTLAFAAADGLKLVSVMLA